MTLQALDHLAQNFRAFSPLKPDFIDQFLPGLSSVATKVISGDLKATMKVKVAMVDLWQVTLRNCFDNFETQLAHRGKKVNDSKKQSMLSLKVTAQENNQD